MSLADWKEPHRRRCCETRRWRNPARASVELEVGWRLTAASGNKLTSGSWSLDMPKTPGFGRHGCKFTHRVHHGDQNLVTLDDEVRSILSRCNYGAGC